MTAKEINKDFKYLCSKVNWGSSFLDAEAVTIINELTGKVTQLEKEKIDAEKELEGVNI